MAAKMASWFLATSTATSNASEEPLRLLERGAWASSSRQPETTRGFKGTSSLDAWFTGHSIARVGSYKQDKDIPECYAHSAAEPAFDLFLRPWKRPLLSLSPSASFVHGISLLCLGSNLCQLRSPRHPHGHRQRRFPDARSALPLSSRLTWQRFRHFIRAVPG